MKPVESGERAAAESGDPSRRVLRSVLLIFLAAESVAVVFFWVWGLFARHAVERAEVPMLVNVLWFKSGFPLYTYPDSLPLIQNPYGPVFGWLCTNLPSFEAQPYLIGRVISLLAIVGIGIGAAIWLRRERAPWPAIALAEMLIFGSKPWILFGPLYRVDALAVLLSFLGLLLVVNCRSRRSLTVALVLFGLAFNVKLTAIAAPVAAVLYLWTIDRKRSVGLATGVALVLPAGVLLLQRLTDGAYLFNASFGNEPVHVLQAVALPSRVLLSLFWLIGLAIAVRRIGVPKGSARSAAGIWAVVSLGTAAAFSLNPIASWNYLMELYLALGLLTGSFMAGLWDTAAARIRLSRATGFLAVHAVVGLIVGLSAIGKTSREILEYRERYNIGRERLLPLIDEEREVLILDSLAGMDALAGLGRPNAISMPAALESRSEIQSLIRRLVRQGDYEVIMGDDLAGRESRGFEGGQRSRSGGS